MKYKILLLIISLLFFTKMEAFNINNADKGSRIEVDIPNYPDEMLYLIGYWDGETYAKDSVTTSDKGKAVFSFPEELTPGQYVLYSKKNIYLDLLIDSGQNDIKIKIDNPKDYSTCKITGSKDTELFWTYLSNLQKNKIEGDSLLQVVNNSTSINNKSETENKIKELNKKMKGYINSQINNNSPSWFSSFIKGLQPINYPVLQTPLTDDGGKGYMEYMNKHYFDNIDLTDARYWQTNYFVPQIDNYMNQIVYQTPDSLAMAAYRLVEKTKGNDICFKKMLSKLMNDALKSNLMGQENIWAKLTEEYILDKEVSWIDSTQLRAIKDLYEPLKTNRIGMKAHSLKLEDINGKKLNTDNIKSDFLVLYFYNPDCTHCQKEAPIIHDSIYSKLKKGEAEIIAININANEKKIWDDFVKEKKLTKWINAGDPNFKSKYWLYFDTSKIPAIYVLDKDKNIIARKLDANSLEQVLKFYGKLENGIN